MCAEAFAFEALGLGDDVASAVSVDQDVRPAGPVLTGRARRRGRRRARGRRGRGRGGTATAGCGGYRRGGQGLTAPTARTDLTPTRSPVVTR